MGSMITGWGTALPGGTLDNSELAQRFGVTEDWILERTGIASRRIAGSDESTLSLAVEAGAAAIKKADLSPDEIDFVILATCTPGRQVPAVAPLIQDALGAGHAGSMDVNAVCSGFLYGLAQAAGLVATETASRVLLIGADTFTRVVDPT